MDKVIHFLPSLTTGGAPINVFRLIKLQSKRNYSIRHVVCSPFDNLDMEKKFLEEGIEIIEMPSVRRFLTIYKFLIYLFYSKKISRKSLILGVLHGRGCGFIIKPFLILINVRTVHFYRGYTSSYGLKDKSKSYLLRQLDKVLGRFGTSVAVGSDEANLVQKFLQPQKLITIRNPVPIINWEKKSSESEFSYGFVGRRSMQKGFDRAIYLCEQNPNLKFVWIGEHEGQQFKDLSIPDNLKLIKYLPQEEIFKKIRVIICVSRWEGCSTVISECVRSAKPFLAIHCPGVSEFNVARLNDHLYFWSLEELSNGISEINSEQLTNTAFAIQSYFESEMSIEANLEKWDDLIF